MSRDRRSNGFFLLMIAAVIVALYYGAVMASTSDKCGTNQASKWVWVPPPHWECLSSQG